MFTLQAYYLIFAIVYKKNIEEAVKIFVGIVFILLLYSKYYIERNYIVTAIIKLFILQNVFIMYNLVTKNLPSNKLNFLSRLISLFIKEVKLLETTENV